MAIDIEAIATQPRPWAAVYLYDDGTDKVIPCRTKAAAENHVAGNAGKILKPLLDRSTGLPVPLIVDLYVEYIGEGESA